MIKSMKNYFLQIIFLLSMLIFIAGPVLAEDTTPPPSPSATQAASNSNASQAAGNPLILDLNAEPGKILPQIIGVNNSLDQTVLVYAGALDFELVGSEGTVQFVNTVNAEHGMASWVRFADSSFDLDAKKGKNINLVIQVPQDAAPGGHWAMLAFKSVDPNDNSKALDQSFVLVMLTVKGSSDKEVLSIKKLSAEKNIGGKGLDIIIEFSNTSSLFSKPKGKITVYNTWGKKIKDFDTTDITVFPHVVANKIETWETGLRIGKYNIEYSGYYGPDNTEIKAKCSYIVWPWQVHLWRDYKWWLVGIFAGLIGLVLIIRFVRIYRFNISMKRK